MTTLTLNSKAGFWKSLWHHTAVVPFYAIQKWFAIFLITTGTLYASAMFSMQHGIFPAEIAYPLAIGIEWTYLSGLAYATELRSNRWSVAMILSGAITSGLYGVLYILGHYAVIPVSPDPKTAVLLALAHVIPLIELLIVYTICKRGFLIEQRTIKETEQQRQREIEDRQRERTETWRDEKLQIEIERDRLALERERVKLSQEAARAQLRAVGMMPKMPKENGIMPETKGKTVPCCKCQKQVAWATPSEAGTIKRWGCVDCRNQPKESEIP